tara:strand:- start:255 stop:500 length:246 start_codon:yes stop_codon:yes gene_type:complete
MEESGEAIDWREDRESWRNEGPWRRNLIVGVFAFVALTGAFHFARKLYVRHQIDQIRQEFAESSARIRDLQNTMQRSSKRR